MMENTSKVFQKNLSQSEIENTVDIIDILPTLKNLVSSAKEKARENEIFFTDDMRLTVYFCLSTILRAINGNRRQLDQNDKNLIAYLKRVGCNSNEIAFAVNRSKGSIIEYLKEHKE